MADKDLKSGDRVEWDSSGGHSTGRVVAKVTKTARVKGHVAKATPEHPQYRVKSDNSSGKGGEALHKPAALERAK